MSVKSELNDLKQIDIAALLGVTTRTIHRWHDEGLPRHGEGPTAVYVWGEVLPWYVAFVSGSGKAEEADDRRRKDKAEADIAEMKRDQLAGTLVDALEVRAVYADFLARLRTNIRGLPDRLIPRLEEGASLPERLSIAKGMVDGLLRDVVAQEEAHRG